MGLSSCNTVIDLHQKELATRGNRGFPIACYEDHLNESNVPWHWHEEWEYAVVNEGTPVFLLEGIEIPIAPGDGILVNAKALHGVKADENGIGILHSAVFHPRLIGGNQDSVYWETLVEPLAVHESTRYFLLKQEVPRQKEILVHFEAAWMALAEETEAFAIDVRYHLSKGIGILLENIDFAKNVRSRKDTEKAERLRTMMEFVEEHYREELSVDQIAGSVSISNSACLRCFRELLNITPSGYLIETRLRKAAALLTTDADNVKDIALSCGFNDVSYFTRIFREQYGSTPVNYRKQHRSFE